MEYPSGDLMYFVCRGDASGTLLRYLDWANVLENATITPHVQGLSFHFPYVVEEVYWTCELDPGSTIIGVHKNENVTAEATDTQDPGAANTGVLSKFGVQFAANDRVQISIDPTDDPDGVRAVVGIRRLDR